MSSNQQIEARYPGWLNREPSGVEVAWWAREFGDDMDLNETYRFYQGALPEIRASYARDHQLAAVSVGALYRLFLDRDPEPAGRDHWLRRFGAELADADLVVFRGEAALERPSGSSVGVRFGGQGNDTIDLAAGSERNFASGGLGDDTLTGSATIDFLAGGAGNDSILGGAGDDSLVGSPGNDTLAGGAGIDTVLLNELLSGADTVVSEALGIADADIVAGFDTGTDRFDYNGGLTLTGGVTAVSGVTLAGALAADPAAEVLIVTGNIADNGPNLQGLYCAAMFASSARSLASDYAAFEAQLLAPGGALGAAVAGLDAAVAVGEQVLLVLDDGMASVVLRYTAQAGDADVVLAAELDLVAVLTNTAQMGVADFV